MGLERMAMLLQGKKTPYELEIFAPTISFLEENMDKDITKELSEEQRTKLINKLSQKLERNQPRSKS